MKNNQYKWIVRGFCLCLNLVGNPVVGGQYIQIIKFFGGFQSFAGLLLIAMSK